MRGKLALRALTTAMVEASARLLTIKKIDRLPLTRA